MRTTALSLFALLAACAPRSLPARSSPTPAPIADGPSPGSVVDEVALEPTWWDAATGRVMRLEGSDVVVVRDEALPEPYRVRVLDDDTIVTFVLDVGLTVFPSGGAPFVVPEASTYFDGVDLASLWYLGWGATSREVELCRARAAGSECVATLTFPYGPGPLGVDGEGAPYVTGGEHVQRWDGTALRPLSGGESDQPVSFRHGIGPGLLLVGYAAVYGASSAGVETLLALDGVDHVVAGAPDHFVVGSLLRESTRSCGGDWFGSACSSTQIWSQWVFTDVTGGVTREIGHQDCARDAAASMPSCAWTTDALSLGATSVTIVGAPLRALPL